jgi:hypothetical protein
VLAIYDSENSRIPIYRERREWRKEGMLEGRGWWSGKLKLVEEDGCELCIVFCVIF